MSLAYYNENDPRAAAWLRELIARDHIAPGYVDERSIADVRATDLAGYVQCHFFAGIGVWSAALRGAGWSDERGVWTGSCPCQPFSDAGRGDGFSDVRHLWPEFYRLIAECNPPVVFGEQVASKDGLTWLDLVHADLEASGYAVGAVDLSAAGVGAPHIRQRLYWVADADEDGRGELGAPRLHERRDGARGGESAEGNADGPRGHDAARCSESRGLGNAERAGLEGHRWDVDERHESGRLGASEARPIAAASAAGDVGHAGRERCREAGHPSGPETRHAVMPAESNPTRGMVYSESGGCGECGDAALTRSSRHADSAGIVSGLADTEGDGGRPDAGAVRGGSASGLREPKRQDERGPGIEAGRLGDSEPTRDGPGPTNGHWRPADWLLCRDGKWRPVEPGTFPLAHGTPERVGRLRGYGNAINLAVAEEFILAFREVKGELATDCTREAVA